MASKTLDLTEGPILQKLMAFFMPLIASSLFQQLYATVDSIIVGRICGKYGLAAIDAVGPLAKLPINFFNGISSGATIIISQLFGAMLYEKLKKAEHTAIALSLVGGICMSILGALIAPWAVGLMGVPETIYANSLSYIRIFFAGLGFSLIYNIAAGILRAVGNTKTPFRILIVAGLLNVVLDYIFVGPLNMNVKGAALATVIAQGVSAALALRVLMQSEEAIRLYPQEIRFDRSSLSNILKLGLPTSLQNSLYPVSNMIVQSSINALGADTIAAWGLSGKIDLFIWLCMGCLGPTASTFTAQNIGAGKRDRARKGSRIMIYIGFGIIGTISLLMALFVEPLSKIFIDSASYDIIPLTKQIVYTMAPFYFTFVIGSVLAGTIQGAGETIVPMYITLLGTCGIRIGWVYFVLPIWPGMISICWCYVVSWVLTSLIYLIYYQYFRRHRLANLTTI